MRVPLRDVNVRPKTVLFCGTRSRFGLAHLAPVLQMFDVAAVVFATDKRWRYFEKRLSGEPNGTSWLAGGLRHTAYVWRSRLRQIAQDRKLRSDLRRKRILVLKAFDANHASFIDKIRALTPDLLLCAAYPQILSKELISVPRQAAINFHPSVLPKFRGAHPHFWALAKGERTGGVSAHLMTERIDDGDIVAQITFSIDGDYYEDYYRKIVDQTPRLIAEVFKFLTNPASKPIQQDSSLASFFKNDKERDWRVLWPEMSAMDVYNLIRTERAFCFFRSSTRVQIARAEVIRHDEGGVAGTIQSIDDDVVVQSIDGAVAIKAFRQRGNLIPAAVWARELGVAVGERFS